MTSKTIDVSHLAQAWVHSHEEDTATTTVYRPAGFPFPPSRGRKGFHLQPGGTLTARNPDRAETGSDGPNGDRRRHMETDGQTTGAVSARGGHEDSVY
jgi:hypothetical protein